MTKKHFEQIAAIIKARVDARKGRAGNEEVEWAMESRANALCGVFIEANPRFDKARFMAACGF